MTVEVDEDFLFALLDFTKLRGIAADEEPQSLLNAEGDDLPEAPQAVTSTEVYFESLELQPVQLDLSFMRTETLNSNSECAMICSEWLLGIAYVYLTACFKGIVMPLPTSSMLSRWLLEMSTMLLSA